MLTITTITTKQSKENSNGESDFNKGNTLKKVEWFGQGAAILELSKIMSASPTSKLPRN